MWPVTKLKFILQKLVSWTANDPNLIPPSHIPLVSFTFGVHCVVSISLYAGKGKCCIWAVNKVEIHFEKGVSWTTNDPI